METALQKGFGYVTRCVGGKHQVLVFDHVESPEAGTQVPGGTLEEGETPLAGILREVFEESGLTDLRVQQDLGMVPWRNPATVDVDAAIHELAVQQGQALRLIRGGDRL